VPHSDAAAASYTLDISTGRVTEIRSPIAASLGWPFLPPTISDIAAVGETLTASSPGATSYQWLADGLPIIGATSATYVLTNSEANKMVSVSVGLAIGGTASSGALGPISPFTAIAADGWQATVASPSDLSLSPATVSRAGYDSTATAATISDTIYLTKRVRQVYPSQASFTANNQAVSRYIYAADAIAGATNNSTQVSPKPIANWVMPQRLIVGTSIHWEAVAFHHDARSGTQVACMRARATDGTNYTAWQYVSTTAISTYVEDAQPLEVYRGDIDISSLTAGTVWLEGEVYPHFGVAASVLKSEDNYSAGKLKRTFNRAYFVKNTTRASSPPFAYVSSAGNDATGVVSTTAATAQATPFLTVKGALEKANVTLGSSIGSFDGLRIRIVDTVNMGTPGFNVYGWGSGAVTIERDPDVDRASAIVTMDSNFRPYLPGITGQVAEATMVFYDVTTTRTAGWSFVGESGVKLYVQQWNCADTTGGFSIGFNNSHRAYYGVIATGLNFPITYGTGIELRCLRGVTCDMNNTVHEGWVTVGCKLTRNAAQAYADLTADGHIFYGNKYLNPSSSNPIIKYGGAEGGSSFDLGSIAIVQNLGERHANGNPDISISADTATGNITHAVLMHNTMPGDRWNVGYDDHLTIARTHKFIRMEGNLGTQINTKGDVHMGDAARIGNFAFHHGVGCQGDFYRLYDAAAANTTTGPGTLAFGQAYPGMGTIIGGGAPLYTDDRSSYGTAAGGGDYTLQVGSAARDLMPGPVMAYDIAGNARGSGTQDAGAYQS
jgi:hypothetical protein